MTLTSSSDQHIKAVELDWYAEDESVQVTPRNQKRFEIQKDKAIGVLQVAHRAEQFEKQFGLLLDLLGTWVQNNQKKLHKAIVTLQDGRLTFVVVRAESKYDEEFDEELTELELEVREDEDMDLIELNSMSLPCVSGNALASFLDERMVLVYHGARE